MTTTESRAKTIGYWVATGLAALAFITGGAFDAARGEQVRAIMSHLGYPAYFAALLGVWKILGGLAILAPRMPRLKEWAYAGMFFDLSGAAISHGSVGDPPARILTPLAILVVVVASWALRPRSRVLRAADAAAQASGSPRVPVAV
jgi:uncharacterized membrane protein YphA (DoxX/SURF4 family)